MEVDLVEMARTDPAPRRKGVARRLLGTDWYLGWLFVLPVVLLVFGLVFYPGVLALYLSMTTKLIGYKERFIGLSNYSQLIADPFFRRAVWNTTVFTFSAVLLKLGVGLWMALTLNAGIRAKNFWTAFLLIPWITPTVVSALNWLWIFDALLGVLNYMLIGIGLISAPIGWLSQPKTAMLSIIIANVWRGFPFFGVTLLAGLQTISHELYEAAAVDGATRLRQFWHITLPGLRYVAAVATLLSLIWTFNDFQQVFLMTRGGPGGATHIIGTLTYEVAIDGLNLGKGTAVSVFAFPFMVLVIALFTRFMRKEAEA